MKNIVFALVQFALSAWLVSCAAYADDQLTTAFFVMGAICWFMNGLLATLSEIRVEEV